MLCCGTQRVIRFTFNSIISIVRLSEDINNSRGATALLINRTSGKGLIVDSTAANGPLFRKPFLSSTGWCEKYFLYVFSLFATKKRRKSSSFFQKINILIFFTVTHDNISQLTHKYNKHN